MNKRICIVAVIALALIITTQQASVTVNKLDNVTSKGLAYSGYLPISDKSSDQLFFTYYGAIGANQQTDLKKYPLLIVVGSPGSSAQFLSFAGMGPIYLNPDMTTSQHSWSPTQYANVMFVDLLGNGFSFVSDTSSFPTKSQDYGVQLTYAINAFAKQSLLGQSSVVILVGQGTFIRSLPGLDDIDTLTGIVHVSSWPQLYAVSRYYGVAGMQLKIFGSSQRVAVESTLISCYNYVTNKKYTEAHNCYESVLNFVESKTKNANLYNIKLGSNLTEHMATIQYFLTQSSIVSAYKAPTSRPFDTQSYLVWSKTFTDLAVNKTSSLSQFMKDYMTIKHWFVSGDNDFISYKQSVKFWLENQLSFVQSAAFKAAKLEDVTLNGQLIGYGKQVKQVKYTELIDAGHYIANDQPKNFYQLLGQWVATFTAQQSNHITEEQSEYLIVQQ